MKKNNSRPGNKTSSSQAHRQAGPRGSSQNAKSQNANSQGGHRAGPAAKSSGSEVPRDWRPVIGTHAIKEALKVRPKSAKVLWLKQGWESSQELREIQEITQAVRIQIEPKPISVIDRFGPSHQGAVLFMSAAPEFSMEGLKPQKNSIVLILDGIEDPHNLGAILRTSWLTGVEGVLIPEDRAVGLTPTVHKVACGGAEHVPVKGTTNFANHAEELKKAGYWIYGLSAEGKKSIFELDLPEKVVWAIGSEEKGMRITTERLCDELVYIPQTSAAASYNASVAAAMALTETLRQHSGASPRKK